MAAAQSDAIPPQNREHTAGPRGVLLASLLGAAVLLLLCSRELPFWADRAWPELSPYAQKIDDTVSAVGLDAPYDAVHAWVQRLADDRFTS